MTVRNIATWKVSYAVPRNRQQFTGYQPSTKEGMGLNSVAAAKSKKKLEARVGIEPTHKGFADLSLTTWVPRLITKTSSYRRKKSSHELSIFRTGQLRGARKLST